MIEVRKRVLEGKSDESFVYRIVRPDGEIRHIRRVALVSARENDKVVRRSGTMQDITEQVTADTALRESEQELRAIYDTAAVGIALTGGDGKLLRTNLAFQRMLGRSGEKLKVTPFAEITHADDIEGDLELFHQVLAGTLDGYQLDKRFLDSDGKPVWASMQVTGLKNEQGETEATIATVADITERKHMEEQLRQAQKMEAVGQLTGGVAHDFNNLLAVMLGNLELIRDHVDADSAVSAMIDRSVKASERGAALTHRLLAFSRKQTLLPTTIDLNKLALGMTDMLRRTLGETIEIKSSEADNLWLCHADQSQLENVLLNLAINARDAMPEGGLLTIETANKSLSDEYAAAQAEVEPGDYVMLGVSDTGSGMAKDTLQHIFEPFYTTKELGKGTGLGLSMVYGFAKQSGGNVTIYSEPGDGTTVKLYLPRSVGQNDDAALDRARSDIPSSQGEKILIVEDDADVRTLAVALLSGLGYEIAEAASGEAALEVMKYSAAIDLLLSDVVLPGAMNGPDLAAEVRRQGPTTKIVYMTGYAEQAFDNQNTLDEHTRVLQKPFKKADLATTIRSVLDDGKTRT